jgi:hypothetical protein
MRKKDILVKSKYNRISVAFVKEGKKDKKAELRIWVTKGRCSPVFDEIMIFDLNSDNPDEFISKANAIIKDLKERYFDHYDDEEKRKEKQRKYREHWLSRGNNKEDVKEYHRQRRSNEEVIIKHRADNVKYYSQVKATYSGRKDWDPEEDNYIKNNLNVSLIEMAKHLGRSISSVSQRKHKIVNGLLYMK